jgi:hypothetical protein
MRMLGQNLAKSSHKVFCPCTLNMQRTFCVSPPHKHSYNKGLKNYLEGLEVVDEDVGYPEVVDEVQVDRGEGVRLRHRSEPCRIVSSR